MIDQKSKSVTSLFMVLAIVAMAALAYSVSQRSDEPNSNESVPAGALRDWVDRSITKLPAERVSKLTVSYPDGKTMTISKNSTDSSVVALEETLAGGTWRPESEITTVANIPADGEMTGFAPVTVTFETPDGLIVATRVLGSANRTLLQVTASATNTTADPEVQSINARTSDRLYQVEGYQPE